KKKVSKVLLSSTLLLTMLFVTMPTSLFAAVVVEINETNFPDAEFRTYVKTFDNNPADNKLSETELGNVLTINVNRNTGTKISSLKGIEHFTQITTLECGENSLTDLNVTKNELLNKLDFHGNQIESIDLKQNVKLTQLLCNQNKLTSLDVSQNPLLTELYCFTNQLTSLDVSQNRVLINLVCDNNQLTSLDVRQNTELKVLVFGDNQLTSLDVSQNTKLDTLICGGNQLTSLDVSKNPALNAFNCSLQKRTLTYDKNKGYLLSAYDKDFVKGKAFNFNGATYNDGTLTGVTFKTPIKYEYNTECQNSTLNTPMDVTLTFDEPTEISRLEDAKILAEKTITGILATNETTNKIILDAVIKSVSSVDGVSAAWKAGSPTITLATKDTAGSITGTIILTCGSKTMEVTVNQQIGKLPTPTPDKPTITAGNNGANHQANSSNDMTFTCSGRLEDLNGIYVDGKLIDKSNYKVNSENTILTLKSSYLNTLSGGKHVLKFQFKDNVAAETDFTITAKSDETPAKPSTPNTGDTSVKPGVTNTGDTSNTMLCFGLMILSGCLAGYSLKKKKTLRS
ncbi:MAG: hypothetical protein RR585_09270, partial [Coprobacillus sp.]